MLSWLQRGLSADVLVIGTSPLSIFLHSLGMDSLDLAMESFSETGLALVVILSPPSAFDFGQLLGHLC